MWLLLGICVIAALVLGAGLLAREIERKTRHRR